MNFDFSELRFSFKRRTSLVSCPNNSFDMLLPVPVQVESLWLHLLVCGLSRRHHLPSGFRCPVSLLDHINFSVRTKVNLPNKTKHFCFVSACVWAFQTWYWSTLERIYLELESLSRDVHLWLSSPPLFNFWNIVDVLGYSLNFWMSMDEETWTSDSVGMPHQCILLTAV